jgi:hypothetical protein
MNQVVFLVDVDNTLLDNDHIQADINGPPRAPVRCRLSRPVLGNSRRPVCRTGVSRLSRCTAAVPCRTPAGHASVVHVFVPGRLPVRQSSVPGIAGCARTTASVGPTVLLTDGDVVFQPRKVERSGLSEAVNSHVLIYIHKELALDDVESRYPALHYVLVDDKPRILAAVKDAWGTRHHRLPPTGTICA